MDKLINQFRRIYADNGTGDMDFSEQEERLRQSQLRLQQATQELVRTAERLRDVALSADISDIQIH